MEGKQKIVNEIMKMLKRMVFNYMREQKIWHWCATNSGTPVNKHVHKSAFERQTATSFLATGI